MLKTALFRDSRVTDYKTLFVGQTRDADALVLSAVSVVNTAPAFVEGDGIVTTDFGGWEYARSVTVQSDGKIIVVGQGGAGFALARYNSDGSLDTGFSGDGKATAFTYWSGANGVVLQSNGKILVAGIYDYYSSGSDRNGDFALARYNSNGSLDTSFNGDGKVITDFGSQDYGAAIAVQADGKILVVGSSNRAYIGSYDYDYAVARYNKDGSLDNSFDGGNSLFGDGRVTTDVFSYHDNDYAASIAVQADGKILVAGSAGLVRYNSNGSLDSSFSGDGKVQAEFAGYYSFDGRSVVVQADGKILEAGTGYSSSGGSDFALVRYNSDGSLDTSFSGDGKVSTSIVSSYDACNAMALQSDGKIILAGYIMSGGFGTEDFALVRYNRDGSLDTGFDGDGIVTTALSSSEDDMIFSVTVQADGKILVTGESGISKGDFVLVRYNADGSLDTSFDAKIPDAVAGYTENSAAVILDSTVQIHDSELAIHGNYNGASLTLARHGGANGQDVFSGSGNFRFNGGEALLSGISIGTVRNDNGLLTLSFNSKATQARMDNALSLLAYSNSSDNPPASVQIDWTFSDGNTGAQGAGGALTASGSTTVNITAVNDAPLLMAPTAINYTDTVFDDTFATVASALAASDSDSNILSYGITGATDNGLTVAMSSFYGVLTVTKATGVYSFMADDAAIEALTVAASASFTVTVSDGSLSDSKILAINIAQKGTTESIGNDKLIGTPRNDMFNGLAGDDVINGLAGADTMNGGLGNDSYTVDNVGDVVIETSTLATEIDKVDSSISYLLGANLENLRLTGTAAINGTGNDLNNSLTGNVAANRLTGGNGDDKLIGGLGKDDLTGGSGADEFKFTSIEESGVDSTTRDTIRDFSTGEGDKINLSAMDANVVLKGNNAFTSITVGGAFSGSFAKPGDLYFDQTTHILYGNNDADASADFSVLLTGVSAVSATDFVL